MDVCEYDIDMIAAIVVKYHIEIFYITKSTTVQR